MSDHTRHEQHFEHTIEDREEDSIMTIFIQGIGGFKRIGDKYEYRCASPSVLMDKFVALVDKLVAIWRKDNYSGGAIGINILMAHMVFSWYGIVVKGVGDESFKD